MGAASLDESGKVPAAQLPSYVDDTVEGYLSGGKFYEDETHKKEIAGESGKIYVELTTNKTYRWSGTQYVEISASLALGETPGTAFPGNKGKVAYDHSQTAHAPADAQKNVQADWNETNSESDAFIKNKPESFPASMITEDATHRFATDEEKKSWNAKADIYFGAELPKEAPVGAFCFLTK